MKTNDESADVVEFERWAEAAEEYTRTLERITQDLETARSRWRPICPHLALTGVYRKRLVEAAIGEPILLSDEEIANADDEVVKALLALLAHVEHVLSLLQSVQSDGPDGQ